MRNKAIAIVTTVLFLVSLNSCVQIKRNARVAPATAMNAAPRALVIVAIQKKTGERRDFPRKERATVIGDKVVVGRPDRAISLQLSWNDIKDFKEAADGRITEVTLNDGRFFLVTQATKNEQGIKVQAAFPYQLVAPLSDIDLIWVRKTNWPVSALASVGATIVIAVGAFALAWYTTPKDERSCPFVYSFDGKEYVLDAEPYGGSVCPGLERADWIGLDNLKAVDGRYKLMLSNELDEVEHVDELKLVVVDHPTGVAVFPELSGRMRTVASPLTPASARDADGRDIRPLLTAKDQTFWLGRVEGRDPDNDDDLKDELILEFDKPAGARQAKLVANAWTTRWGSQAIKPLLASQGRELGSYFEKINAGGPALLSLMGWFAREEMYNLQVRVETAAGWKTKALVYGGGPVIAKDKVYALDLSDVTGDQVRIKLTPAAGFWMIDRLALDFSADAQVRVTEIAASSARDAAGRDIGEELASDDNAYFVIPKGSRPATLEFAVPPETPGTTRTVFVKARGYYDMLLDAEGEPTLDLQEMIDSPGESLRFLLRQHPAVAKPGPRAPEREARTP